MICVVDETEFSSEKGEEIIMAYITTRKGWEELNNTLVDEETGMTQADLIEWEYDGDIEFIDED